MRWCHCSLAFAAAAAGGWVARALRHPHPPVSSWRGRQRYCPVGLHGGLHLISQLERVRAVAPLEGRRPERDEMVDLQRVILLFLQLHRRRDDRGGKRAVGRAEVHQLELLRLALVDYLGVRRGHFVVAGQAVVVAILCAADRPRRDVWCWLEQERATHVEAVDGNEGERLRILRLRRAARCGRGRRGGITRRSLLLDDVVAAAAVRDALHGNLSQRLARLARLRLEAFDIVLHVTAQIGHLPVQLRLDVLFHRHLHLLLRERLREHGGVGSLGLDVNGDCSHD
mmetsp:Transcript_17537/g.44978  ORF Transcript_17537/g.44978 Transcript_17537/m.44978 type:complete len:284 (-) Transcript_17537:4-855(-)